ncbi:MAG: response regulator, partial [Flavobacteriales bacterium]|nr:response regulator [Flavobacteriales bacterium]
DLKGARILLVEDNDFNIMVAQDELQASIPDVQVDVAKNGIEAVARVKAKTYDLVLMDVQMPEMNGYDATRAIRALGGTYEQLPIIAMTANVMKAEVQRCIDAGMTGFIPKPFERNELLATLHSVLSGRQGE